MTRYYGDDADFWLLIRMRAMAYKLHQQSSVLHGIRVRYWLPHPNYSHTAHCTLSESTHAD